MNTLKATLVLTLPFLAASLPTASSARDIDGPTYYTLTGTNVKTSDSHFLSIMNGQNMLPYYNSFWFGLSKDHWCRAPQPGEGTNFTCNTDTYKPLYTVDSELELATYYVNNRIVRAESGQLSYAVASAFGGWNVTADNLLSYQGDTTFYACPEQRGDAPLAYQVWEGTYQGRDGECVRMNIKADKQAGHGAIGLPYGYSGN